MESSVVRMAMPEKLLLTGLPTEILLAILWYFAPGLYRNGVLVNVMLTCRRLYDVGAQVLYRSFSTSWFTARFLKPSPALGFPDTKWNHVKHLALRPVNRELQGSDTDSEVISNCDAGVTNRSIHHTFLRWMILQDQLFSLRLSDCDLFLAVDTEKQTYGLRTLDILLRLSCHAWDLTLAKIATVFCPEGLTSLTLRSLPVSKFPIFMDGVSLRFPNLIRWKVLKLVRDTQVGPIPEEKDEVSCRRLTSLKHVVLAAEAFHRRIPFVEYIFHFASIVTLTSLDLTDCIAEDFVRTGLSVLQNISSLRLVRCCSCHEINEGLALCRPLKTLILKYSGIAYPIGSALCAHQTTLEHLWIEPCQPGSLSSDLLNIFQLKCAEYPKDNDLLNEQFSLGLLKDFVRLTEFAAAIATQHVHHIQFVCPTIRLLRILNFPILNVEPNETTEKLRSKRYTFTDFAICSSYGQTTAQHIVHERKVVVFGKFEWFRSAYILAPEAKKLLSMERDDTIHGNYQIFIVDAGKMSDNRLKPSARKASLYETICEFGHLRLLQDDRPEEYTMRMEE